MTGNSFRLPAHFGHEDRVPLLVKLAQDGVAWVELVTENEQQAVGATDAAMA